MVAPLALQPVVEQFPFGRRRHRRQHESVVGRGERREVVGGDFHGRPFAAAFFVVFLAAALLAAGFFCGGLLGGGFLGRRLLGRRLLGRRLLGRLLHRGLLAGVQLRGGQLVVRPVLERVEVELTHLGDAVGQVVVGPVVDGDRRVHHDVDGAGVERARVARGDDLGVANHDGHDRDSGRHRDAERSLLERADLGGVQPGALRRDQDRQPLARELLDLLQPLDGLLGVVAVDEGRVHDLAHGADDRIVLELLLADRGEVVADQPAGDHRVGLVAVIEDKHRRPLRGQVLLPQHVEVDAGGRQQRPAEGRREEVDAGAPVAGQQPETDGAGGDRHHRRDTRGRPQLRDRVASAAAAESQHRPAAFGGHRGELARGIGRPRIADEVHQRDVFVAVGVEVALRQVDTVLGGEGLHRPGLARAPDDRA